MSLAIANLVCGNEPGAAALEMTVVGPVLLAHAAVRIGLAGADLGGVVRPGGRRLLPGRSLRLAAGELLAFPGPVGPGQVGRAYLALSGGIDVPVVLGSRSTCLVAGFGGHEGRALRPGDSLRAARPDEPGGEAVWPSPWMDGPGEDEAPREIALRVVAGPHRDLLGSAAIDALCASSWTVGAESDRMGLRLTGTTLPRRESNELLSHGVTWGAIQVPPDGRPIALLADHQPTGGYPVLAVVISADLPMLGQLVPGQQVTFSVVELEEARRALEDQRRRFAAAASGLSEARHWIDASDWAGG